jgi:hypothetical protein
MEFVKDIEKSKARFEAWWNNDLVDRPLVHMTCARATPRWPLKKLPDWRRNPRLRYLDVDYIVDMTENALASMDYYGDTIPHFARDINTAYLGIFAGADPVYREEAVWIDPYVDNWEDAKRPLFDPGHPVFKKMLEISGALAANARGRYMLDTPDHLDCVTTMSQMRGVQALCTDLYDAPASACRFRDAFIPVWNQSMDFWAGHDEAGGWDGYTNWGGVYSRKRCGFIQCDFSVMLSPEMAVDFVRPELAAEAAHLGRAIYHLDGYEQLQHLDWLLEIPGISAIQWISGSNNPTAADRPETIRKIQAAGKPVQIIAHMDEVEKLSQLYSPKGVLLWMLWRPGQKQDPALCERVMKIVEKWR